MIYKDTLFLRAVAIVLILNSHLDAYYPAKHIATGGAFGNTLFFMLSAFGLTISYRKKKLSFISWFSRRLMKILPSVWLTLLLITLPLQLIFDSGRPMGAGEYILGFFIPPYWFLQALLLFYAMGYLLMKSQDDRHILFSMGILYLIYFFFYFNYLDLNYWSIERLPFKVINYMVIFVWGIFLGVRTEKIRYSGHQDLVILACIICIIYGHKFLMLKNILTEYQFIQQILLLPFGYYSLKIARAKWITHFLMQHPIFSQPIALLGTMTLEIYIVHVTLSKWILGFNMSFPQNVLLFLVATVFFSYLIKFITNRNPFLKFYPDNS